MEWSYDNVRLLIDLYREHPVLWDTKLNDYRDRGKRQEAIIEIANRFGLEKEEIERKIKNLVCHFSREMKKERDSIRSGASRKDRYKSKWFCFKNMMFLKDRKRPKEIITQIADEKASHDVSDENNETAVTPHSSHGSTTCTPQNEDEPPKKLFCSSKRRPSKKNHPRPSQDGIIDPIENECTKFGELIAVKLQKFGDEERSILMHRINNFVYEAETEMYAQHHYNYNSASSTPSSPLANQYSQAQYQPSAPQSPVPFSLLKPEQTELSPSNCNSSQ